MKLTSWLSGLPNRLARFLAVRRPGVHRRSLAMSAARFDQLEPRVCLTINAVNDDFDPPDYHDRYLAGQMQRIPIAWMLSNDTDGNGNSPATAAAFELSSQPAGGMAWIESGDVVFIPIPGWYGQTSFEYTIRGTTGVQQPDGTYLPTMVSDTASVTVHVQSLGDEGGGGNNGGGGGNNGGGNNGGGGGGNNGGGGGGTGGGGGGTGGGGDGTGGGGGGTGGGGDGTGGGGDGTGGGGDGTGGGGDGTGGGGDGGGSGDGGGGSTIATPSITTFELVEDTGDPTDRITSRGGVRGTVDLTDVPAGAFVELDLGQGPGYFPLNLWNGEFSFNAGAFRGDGRVSLRARAVAVHPLTGERLESDWSSLNFELKRFELTGHAFGVGWEGESVSYLVKATSAAGAPDFYDIDIDNNGSFDITGIPHEALIGGTLVMNAWVPGAALDNGTYTSKVRVSGMMSGNGWAEFEIPLRIGNLPPRISIGGGNGALPEEDVTLSVSTSDIPLDTVTSLAIDWGDGTTETVAATFATFTHAYDELGQYTVTVTATDEDGAFVARHLVAVAYPSTPQPTGIRINSSVASVNGNTATLVVDAEGPPGALAPSYQWTLPAGIYGSVSNGNTITFNRLSSEDWFEVTLKLTNFATGETLEVMYVFLDGGAVNPAVVPTPQNYYKLFRAATPEMPADWQVHHIYQVGRTANPQDETKVIFALHNRFMRQTPPLNVNETQFLRAVRPDIHARITADQTKWWKTQMAKHGWTNMLEAAQKVDLDEYKAFANQLRDDYAPYMAEVGSEKKAFAKIVDLWDNKGGYRTMGMSRPSRLARYGALLERIAVVTGVFAVVFEGAQAMAAVADHPPEAKAAFAQVESTMEACIAEAEGPAGRIRRGTFLQYADAMKSYAISLKLNPDVANSVYSIIAAKAYNSLEE